MCTNVGSKGKKSCSVKKHLGKCTEYTSIWEIYFSIVTKVFGLCGSPLLLETVCSTFAPHANAFSPSVTSREPGRHWRRTCSLLIRGKAPVYILQSMLGKYGQISYRLITAEPRSFIYHKGKTFLWKSSLGTGRPASRGNITQAFALYGLLKGILGGKKSRSNLQGPLRAIGCFFGGVCFFT